MGGKASGQPGELVPSLGESGIFFLPTALFSLEISLA